MRTNGNSTKSAVAVLTAVLLLAGCASGGPTELLSARPEPVQPEGPLAAVQPEVVTIEAIEIAQSDQAARIDIRTSEALVWTTYRDENDQLVIELPNSRAGAGVDDFESTTGLVRTLRVAGDASGGRSLTRLVVAASGASDHSVSAAADGLTIEMGSAESLASLDRAGAEIVASADVAEEPWVEDAAPAMPQMAEEPVAETTVWEAEGAGVDEAETMVAEEPAYDDVADSWIEESDVAEAPVAAPQVAVGNGQPATELLDIDVMRVDGSVVVRILGDGEFSYETLSLEGPYRYVVDLAGVANFAPRSVYNAGDAPVEQVRVAQFKSQPDPVSRVVVDLAYPATPELVGLPEGLALSFGGAAAASWSESSTLVDDVAEAPAVVEPAEDLSQVYEEVPAAYDSAETTYVESDYDEPVQYAQTTIEQEPAPMVEEPVVEEPMVEEYTPVVEEAPMVEPAAPVEAPATPINVSFAEPPAEDESGDLFSSRQVGEPADGKVYRGEPITLRLKDADIRDLLRSFSEFSGLNFVIQPGVRGTVTVELADVPWDQALDLILKTNDLGYDLEGNILRIAPLSKLREEAEAEQALRSAQAQAVPLSTVIRRVSYATANQVARVLKSGSNSILSRRGTVVVDSRTNTLIIKELPDYIDTVIAVIETLDIPEPQVMIEARIIETTKRFSRTLGINWGFSGISSAATGNTTGLVFPNNGTVDGGVDLTQAGNGSLGITLGNVLNTFQLDVALQAAENEGLINILSAPRITTLNNESASIQSGLQIPIQTVSNNTVSVQFVNATLSLNVTPHVTAEGTVLMDIAIQKREPLLAFAVAGAANAPISTKDASTKVIVRDGGTTVIGGIYEVSSDEGQDKVPGLSKVPFLKHLFKNNRQSEENEELLIFITPRVVNL